MKVMTELYPKGTLQYQSSDGLYMQEELAENIKILARNIVNDLQFFGIICSSTYEVRTGKSTLAQQIGKYYSYEVEKIIKREIPFSCNNIVFKTEDLIKRALTLPKYSALILDENDEVDESYYSYISKALRFFLRKSGQLNLFIIMIAPNFFQLKPSFAISRSNFLIDVYFDGEFERGFFKFFNFERKKLLYLQGKKFYDYNCVTPNFKGRFTGNYMVDKEEYLRLKLEDLKNIETPQQLKFNDVRKQLIYNFYKNIPDIDIELLAKGFNITKASVYNAIKEYQEKEEFTNKIKNKIMPFKVVSSQEENSQQIQ
ncbi:MAG: hypothetical protein QXF25_01980 [Candidatus Pacearchaeota archaeon]